MTKTVLVIAVVAILGFCLMFHVVTTNYQGVLIIPKQSPSFAHTFITVDSFLDEWNGMLAFERLETGPMRYLKVELTKRKIIGPVD